MIVSAQTVLVDPTADLQAAVDATPAGGTLRLAAGTYTVPTGGLLISQGIHIVGSGHEATILQPYSVASSQPVIRIAKDASIVPDINDVQLTDFQINGGAVAQDNAPADLSGSYGIQIDLASTQLVRHVLLQRLYIWRCSNHGVYVTGNGGDTAVIGLRVRDCVINENWGDGAFIQGATLVEMESNLFAQNYGRGLRLESCGAYSEVGNYYESNCHSADLGTPSGGGTYDGQVSYYSSVINVLASTCEAFNTNTGSAYLQQQATKFGMTIQNCSGRVSGCKFYNSASISSTDERGMFISNAAYSPTLEIGPNMFDGCYIAISANADVSNGLVRNLSIWPQNQHTYEALILQSPGVAMPSTPTSLVPTLNYGAGGQVLFDQGLYGLRLWSGDRWMDVVAGQVSYEDAPVIYEDDPVTY